MEAPGAPPPPPPSLQAPLSNISVPICNREEQNLFLLPLLFVAFVIIITKRMLSIAVSIHNGQPQGTLPLCLNVKLKCLGDWFKVAE